MNEYPKMLYKSKEDYLIAEDEAQELEMLEQGYMTHSDLAKAAEGGSLQPVDYNAKYDKPGIIQLLEARNIEHVKRHDKADLIALLVADDENNNT